MHVRVRVKAGARKELFSAVDETLFTIAVREPAEQNRANLRVRTLLAEYFEVTPRQVKLLTGHHAPHKLYEIK
jgi:uncharacterized protein YggU (UPF0235/DUF167 family)